MQWLSDALYRLLTDVFIRLWYTYEKFNDVKDTIYKTAWVPNFLGDLFGGIAGYFHDWYYEVRNLRGELQKYTDFLNALLHTETINSLLTSVFQEWEAFKRSPYDYIVGKLDDHIPEFWKLRTDPKNWVLSRIYEYDPAVWSWLVHPAASLQLWFDTKFPGLLRFFGDPVTEFIAWLKEKDYEAYNWLKYPVTMAKKWLEDEVGIPYSFWLDPWREGVRLLADGIEDHIEIVKPYLLRTGERLARYLWEGKV